MINKKRLKLSKLLLGLLAIAAIAITILRFTVVPKVDAERNRVLKHSPYKISKAGATLHKSLRVSDLHADTLLWKRNPARQQTHGHTDIPRLRAGGVRVQVFSAVTKSPKGQNYKTNSAKAPDRITQLAMAQLWPIPTWNSLYERAAYQAKRLRRLEKKSNGKLVIAKDKANFKTALSQPDTLIGILEIEGAHALEGKLSNIDKLYDEGYRMMGLLHFFDNELGGSMHGHSQKGLSKFGKKAIAHMDSKGIILDMAHASEASVRDVLRLTQAPLVLSHGGVRSACARTKNRNLPDDVLKQMAVRGSLIGIAFFNGAICDITPNGIADSLIYAVDLLGEDAVALGSDFDGSVTTALDASELAAITDALLKKGMNERVTARVMGENAIRFISENLPD